MSIDHWDAPWSQQFKTGGTAFLRQLADEERNKKAKSMTDTLVERLFDEIQAAVLYDLPRTHKGFRCQYEQDHIRRSFERVKVKFASKALGDKTHLMGEGSR